MTEALLNMVRREVHRVLQVLIQRPRVGTVSSYDPDAHAVKVMLQPENKESGWIPLATQHIGNGYGLAWGPEVGDQVEIGFQEGDISTPRVVGRLHSDEDKPPRVEAGEMLLKRKDGSQIIMNKNGNVHIHTKGTLFINMGDKR